MKRECPYCRENLDEQEAGYLLHWVSEEGEREAQELSDFLKEYKNISDKRKNERFEKLWKLYGYQTREEIGFSPSDMILIGEEAVRLKKFLESPDKSSFMMKKKNLSEPVFGAESRNKSLVRENIEDGQNGEKKINNYFYQKKNPQNEWDYQADVSYGIRDHVVMKIRRVCGKCYNLIPDDLYTNEMIKVYLIAGPSAGKTCMLYSIFMHQDVFNQKNRPYIEWKSIQDNTIDPFFKEFMRQAKEFSGDTKRSSPTKVMFIPPLFLKVKYRENQDKEEKTVVLALYDNGGEIFLNDEEKNISDEDAEKFGGKIKGMDAILCIISPAENTERIRDEFDLTESKIEKIFQNSKIYSDKEQVEIEQNPIELEKTIKEILEEMTDDNTNAYKSSRELLKTLESRLGGETSIEEIMKNKYLSLVISKIDEISRSEMFQGESGLYFDDINTDATVYFSEEEKQRKAERDNKMIDMIQNYNLIEYDLAKFRCCSNHFVAAYVGGEKNFRPIRVEEPLVYIIWDYFMQKRV